MCLWANRRCISSMAVRPLRGDTRGGDDEDAGSAALQLYAGVVSMFLPIPAENQPGLIADFEGDPFVGHAPSSATCDLYHVMACS